MRGPSLSHGMLCFYWCWHSARKSSRCIQFFCWNFFGEYARCAPNAKTNMLVSPIAALIKTPLIKLSIFQNSSPKCKTQGFQDSMRYGPSCSWHLSTDFLCILCLQLRSPNTTQVPGPPSSPVCGLIEVRCSPALKNKICIGKTMDLHQGPCDKE